MVPYLGVLKDTRCPDVGSDSTVGLFLSPDLGPSFLETLTCGRLASTKSPKDHIMDPVSIMWYSIV